MRPRRLDAVDATARESARLVREPRQCHVASTQSSKYDAHRKPMVVDPSLFPEAQWLYVSETKYQEEVVWLLQYQEKAAPKKSSSFCVIA